MPDVLLAIHRAYIATLKKTKLASALACRLMQWTGKSRWPIHPKHLVDIAEPWYLGFLNVSDRVLDVGCGNGQHTLRAAEKVSEIVGVDYDPKLLEVAQGTARERGIKNARFQQGSVEGRLSFPDASFDKVLCLDVLEHLHKRDEAMREMRRVLKPGGILLLAVPNTETTWKKRQRSVGLPFYSDPDHKIEYTQDEIREVCARHRFAIQGFSPVVYDVWYAGLIDLAGGISLSLYRKLLAWKHRYAKAHPEESIGFEIAATKV